MRHYPQGYDFARMDVWSVVVEWWNVDILFDAAGLHFSVVNWGEVVLKVMHTNGC